MKKITLVLLFLSVLIALSLVSGVHAIEFKLTATDGAEDDHFGYSVAISGDYALIGAVDDDDNGTRSGSAYIFKRAGTSWIQQAKLTASDGAARDHFGCSVAIASDYALVGAWGNDERGPESGSAYIFKRAGTSWIQQAKLTARYGASNDRFGCSVAIAGDYALIGASGDNDKGAAYIFKRAGTSWARQAKLTASDGASNDGFGYSVAIAGDYALVGAPFDDDQGNTSGSAYIFKRTGISWTQQAKLTTSDGMRYDYFGISVAIAGNYALIGASGDDDRGSESGSAYIFKRNGTSWIQQAKLTALYGSAGDYFGDSVAITGDYALVGARGDDDYRGPQSGSAHIFKRDGTLWIKRDIFILKASDGMMYDCFGRSVAIAGDYALVGASGKKGSAYIYDGVENNPPKAPTSPSPGNHATGQSINVDLSWTGGDPDAGDTVTYDVHFSDWLSSYGYPPLVSYDQLGTTFKPGTLSYNTTYYWKIVATDNHGESTSGPTWDFTTGSKI